MAKSHRNKSEPGLLGKGQRYWSIMLVGEHGRVIPFRRFKEIAISVIALACLSLAALAVIAFLYTKQTEAIDILQREVEALRRETVQLKDEKDVLHAKLVIYEMQKAPEGGHKPKGKEAAQGTPKPSPPPAGATPPPKEAQPVAASAIPAPTVSSPVPTPTPPPSVNWVLDLQRFNAEYDARRELIRFTVRVVNKTTPRQSFSGRMVLVLKKNETAPNTWISLPSGPLVEGKPSGKTGQAFTVQNYRTMDFKLYKQRPPVEFDTATCLVFLSSGEQVISQDFGFKIEAPPPPTPATKPEPTAMPLPTPAITPSATPAASPSAPPFPMGTSDLQNNIDADSLAGSGKSPDSTPLPSQVQSPQATATPGASSPVPPSPAPVLEERLETEPTR